MTERIVLSIDIGVKNLGYCLLSQKNKSDARDGNKMTIFAWDSINLLDETYPSCQTLIKSGKRKGEECGKPGNVHIFASPDSDIPETYYCSTHNPDKTKYIPKQATKVKNVLLKDKCLALYNALEKLPNLISMPHEVVIEQQMRKNPTMIQMSHLVYSYFLMKGYVNPASPIRNIRFISAKHKLQVAYNGPPLQCKLKNAYNQRKWYSCEYTKWLVRNDPVYHMYLLKFPKKKDDLSDCYLQGVWWLNNYGNGNGSNYGNGNGSNYGQSGRDYVKRKGKKRVKKSILSHQD